MTAPRRILVFTVILLILGAAVPQAQRTWTEVRSAHYTVITDINDRTARDVAWQLEQMRGALLATWPWANVDTDRPLLAIAIRGEEAMKQLVPGMWGGFNTGGPATVFASGPDRHYIALRADIIQDDRVARVNPYGQAFWSIASVVINTNLGRTLPPWLSRGLATVMGNTLIANNGIQLGRMPPSAIERLNGSGRLRLNEMFAVDHSSPWITNTDRQGFFDAEASAFVHYLMFGDNGAHRDAMDRFVTLVREGHDGANAANIAFGDLDALEDTFLLYLRRTAFAYGALKIDTTLNRNTFTARAISPAESAAARAGIHVALSRPAEARALIQEARKTEPALASAHDVEGILLDSERKGEEALAAYSRAVDAGTTNSYVQYRWASLTWNRPDTDDQTRARVHVALEESAKNNPRYAPTFALLAQAKSRLGKPADGIEPLRRAIALQPVQAGYRMMLANTLWNSARRAEALQEARNALAVASTAQERGNAQQMVSTFETRLSTPPPAEAGPMPSTLHAAASVAPPVRVTGSGSEPIVLDPKACEAGNVEGCAQLIKVAESNCQTGDVTNCALVGQFYLDGRGVAKDPVKSAMFFEKACDMGSPPGCLNFSIAQSQGNGVTKDTPRATERVAALCNAGYRNGCVVLATFLLQTPTLVNLTRARDILTTECAAKTAQACDLLKFVPQ